MSELTKRPVVVLAGAGGLSYSLIRALHQKGFPVAAVFSRNPDLARHKIQMPQIPIVDYTTRGLEADVLILAVPDSKMLETARQVCADNRFSCVVHCSGSAKMKILEDINPEYGVIYPLQTFTPGREISFENVPVFWEGSSPESAFVLQKISEGLSSQSKYLDSESRALLHTGAVFANNFNNFLALIASHFAEKAGQSPDIYQPILEETLAKLRLISAEKAQTGPARRKDSETIERHLAILRAHFPEWEELYQVFSQLISKSF